MKPSAEMMQSPAYLALGGSARSVLRVLLEEIGASGGPVELSTVFFIQAGLSANTLATGLRELTAMNFVVVTNEGTAVRQFSLAHGWLAVPDKDEATRILASAKVAKTTSRPARRRHTAPADVAVNPGANRRLPEGIRRSVWPRMSCETAS